MQAANCGVRCRTSANIDSLQMQLKALEKSRKRHQHKSGSSVDDSRCELVWIMTAQPPLTPTHVREEMAERDAEARHLKVSRHRTSPTAMGQ